MDDEDAAWIAPWLEARRKAGCHLETLATYRWAARRTDASLRDAGRCRDPTGWTESDARWLRNRFRDVFGQMRFIARVARSHGNGVFRTVGLPRPGPPSRVRWLRPAEITVLLEAVRDDRHLRLVALLGLAQGMRRGEWVRLTLSDLDLEGQRIRLPRRASPPGPAVWIPIHPSLPDAVRSYLIVRRRRVRRFLRQHPGAVVPDQLFLHLRGARLEPYRPHGTEKWAKQIERRLRVRGVRVDLATEMLRRGGATALASALRVNEELGPDEVERSLQRFLRTGRDRTSRRAARRVLALRLDLPPPRPEHAGADPRPSLAAPSPPFEGVDASPRRLRGPEPVVDVYRPSSEVRGLGVRPIPANPIPPTERTDLRVARGLRSPGGRRRKRPFDEQCL